MARRLVAAIEADYPPLGAFVECEGLRCHVLQEGRGHPVVLVHGASSNLREWTSSIFDAVASRHWAIAIDRPGHGWSERPRDGGHDPWVQARILEGVLGKLGARRPVLLGHSMAGTVVLAYALAYPERVGGILFLAGVSHPWPGGVGMHHEFAARRVLGSLFVNGLVAPLFRQRAPAVIEQVFSPNPVPEDYYRRAGIELYRRPAAFRANAEDLTRLKPIVARMCERYGSIEAPLLAVAGDSDSVIWTHLHTPTLVGKVRDGRTVVLEGVGHMPHHACPDAIIDGIDELVARS